MMIETDRLVTVSDIARRVGVGRSAVSNWTARGLDAFPGPVCRVNGGQTPLWDWSAVETWAVARGLLPDPAGCQCVADRGDLHAVPLQHAPGCPHAA